MSPKSYAEALTQNDRGRLITPHTRILVTEASEENRFDQRNLRRKLSSKGSTSTFSPDETQCEAVSANANHGKTTKKKQRSRIAKLRKSMSIFRRSNKVAPFPYPCEVINQEEQLMEENESSVVSAKKIELASDVTLDSSNYDENESQAGYNINDGVEKREYKRGKEIMYNLFGSCFGLFKLSRVEDGTELYLTGNKIHLRHDNTVQANKQPCATIDPQVSTVVAADSAAISCESPLGLVQKSIPHINLHDVKPSEIQKNTSNSTVTLTRVNTPVTLTSSRVDTAVTLTTTDDTSVTPTRGAKVKKSNMTKEATKTFWKRIDNKMKNKPLKKLEPLKPSGADFFEIREDFRPCTPKPQLSRGVVRTSKNTNLAEKLSEAAERRQQYLNEKKEGTFETRKLLRAEQQVALRTIQIKDDIRQREQDLEFRKEQERKEKLAKLARDEMKRERVMRQKMEQQRREFEEMQRVQKHRESAADGRRSSMLVTRSNRLREHNQRVQRIRNEILNAGLRMTDYDVPLSAFKELPPDYSDYEPVVVPTSPDEYSWSPLPAASSPVLQNNDSDNEQGNGKELAQLEDDDDFKEFYNLIPNQLVTSTEY